MMPILCVATRTSALALWQTNHVIAELRKHRPELEVRLEKMVTSGDRSLAAQLVGQLEKGFFTEELQAAMRNGKADFAVHSLKDLPTTPAPGLCVGAVSPRASAYDLLVVRKEALSPGKRMPVRQGARVGASSLRRQALIAHYGEDLSALPLRGNVPTRFEKLAAGNYEAIVVAGAGVERLGLDLSSHAVFALDPRQWPPAPGQGAIAVECRAEDQDMRTLLACIDDPVAAAAVRIERQLLRTIEGGCTTPFGAYAASDKVYVGLSEQGRWLRGVAARAPLADLNSPAFEQIVASLRAGELEAALQKELGDEPLCRQIV